MSDRKREHEVDSHEIKRYRREEMDKEEQNESDDSNYQPYIPLKERRKEKDDDQLQLNPQESMEQAIQRCTHSVEHASQCKDDCCLSNCSKLKRIILHARTCSKQGTNNTCETCKHLIALTCYHAKTCQESECPLPFCYNIKNKLKEQRLNQAQFLKRRIAMMQKTVNQANTGNSNSSSQPSPKLPKSGRGTKSAACLPVAAFQDVPQKQAAAEIQSVAQMFASAKKQMQKPVDETQATLDNMLATLKASNFSSSQKQHVLASLKSNPQLMDAFIKERMQLQQQKMNGQ